MLIIQENVPLASFTTWRIGGDARYYASVTTGQLPECLAWAHDRNLPVWFLGKGSNVLIDDAGLNGLVVHLSREARAVEVDAELGSITAEAGYPLPQLAKLAASQGLADFTFLVGIPGSLGGSIVTNAGMGPADGRSIADLVAWVEILHQSGEIERVGPEYLQARYRSTVFSQNLRRLTDEGVSPRAFGETGACVVRACLRAHSRDEPRYLKAIMQAHLVERRQRQPISRRTAGSVFKATAGNQPAALLIQQAGLKGTQVGGALVSRKHANWIENTGTATADDVRQLVQLMRERILLEFGVELESEIVELRPCLNGAET